MKVAVFSDLQIHNYKMFNNGTLRLDNCIKILFDICAYCRANDIKIVFFAGDIHDTFSVMLTVVVNKSIDAWLRIAEQYPEIVFYAISGNHDMANKNLLNADATTCLDYIARIIPNNFIKLDNKTVAISKGVYVSGIPYYEYKEHYAQRLQETVDRNKDVKGKHYLMIHQTAKGTGNDMIPYDTNPADEIYDFFDMTFCGHIHKRDLLTAKFYNVGSPIHRTAEDTGQKKGFLSFEVPAGKAQTQPVFIPLEGYPEFEEKYTDDVTPLEQDNNFVVAKQKLDVVKLSEKAKVDDFNTNLNDSTLTENYWKEVDGKDKELLKMGLSFINQS